MSTAALRRQAVMTLVACRVPRPRARGSGARVLQRAAGVVQVPKGVVFVNALPKNPSGKLLKRELRQVHAALFAAK